MHRSSTFHIFTDRFYLDLLLIINFAKDALKWKIACRPIGTWTFDGFPFDYTNSLVNATFGSRKKSCQAKLMLTKLVNTTWRNFCLIVSVKWGMGTF